MTSPTAASGALKGPRNTDIEILRGIAIAFVLLEHAQGLAPANLDTFRILSAQFIAFWGGVDIFFAISGYVISASLLRTRNAHVDRRDGLRALVAFWIRRAWRLWPAAWFWPVVFFLLTLPFIPSAAQLEFVRASLSSLLGAVFNVANIQQWRFHNGAGFATSFMGQYWSLSLEEQLYFVLAPALLFLTRSRLVALSLALIALQFFLLRSANSTDLSWFVRCDAFAWGVLVAVLWDRGFDTRLLEPTLLRKLRYALPALGFLLALIAAKQLLFMIRFQVGLMAAAAGALTFIASFDRGYLGIRGWMARLMTWLGSRSYAVYLTHLGVFSLTARLAHLQDPAPHPGVLMAQLFVVALLVTFGAAELTYRFLERPARNHGRALAAAYEARCRTTPEAAAHG